MTVQIGFCATTEMSLYIVIFELRRASFSGTWKNHYDFDPNKKVNFAMGNIQTKFFTTFMRFLAQPFPSSIPGPLEDSWLLPKKGFSPIWLCQEIHNCNQHLFHPPSPALSKTRGCFLGKVSLQSGCSIRYSHCLKGKT